MGITIARITFKLTVTWLAMAPVIPAQEISHQPTFVHLARGEAPAGYIRFKGDGESSLIPAQSYADGVVAFLDAVPPGERTYGGPLDAGLRPRPEQLVEVVETEGGAFVKVRGKPFTHLHVVDTPRPYYYPVTGPGSRPVTRNWPMKKVEHEAEDHPHHRSWWFTFGDVNGIDFWSDHPKAGRVEHQAFTEISSGPVFGTIATENRWVAPGDEVICTDRRTLRVYATDPHRIADLEITLLASHGPITFGDTKEGMMALRLAPTLRLKGAVGKGRIVNSEGHEGGATWGKRAAWCDYSGPLEGSTVGVAIFDHPSNLRHPTWWHVRDYGLFAANPFGISYFESKPRGTGNHTVAEGDSITFRYRFLFHEGDEKEGAVAEHYRAWEIPLGH